MKDPLWVRLVTWFSVLGLVLVGVTSILWHGVFKPRRCSEACGQLEVAGCDMHHAICCEGDDCGIRRIR